MPPAGVRLVGLRSTDGVSPTLHIQARQCGAVAAGLLMVMRLGLLGGFEQTRTLAQTLADEHWAHHIDPQGEWLDRGNRPMA